MTQRILLTVTFLASLVLAGADAHASEGPPKPGKCAIAAVPGGEGGAAPSLALLALPLCIALLRRRGAGCPRGARRRREA